MGRDQGEWIPTNQTSHDTTYSWGDTEEMRDCVCIKKLVLSSK